MGRSSREKPHHLGEKLLRIRQGLGLTQNEMKGKLVTSGEPGRLNLSRWENGTHEPPLKILLQYTRLANVYVEVLIDDGLDLPPKLPSPQKHEGVRRRTDNPVRTSKRQPAR
jgi:transcriptional regulator with XRE-family HTH domain